MTDDLVKRLRESGTRSEVELHEDREEAADRIEELEHDLKEAVRALQIARVHVANNECGWSVSRTAARFDLGVIDHIMEKIGASYD
jgi:hypothetical protein